MKNVLIPLATGFEEIEAVTLIDVLRRAELEVTVAGLSEGVIEGSRGIKIEPDTLLADVDVEGFDAIVLPGGLGGTNAMIAEPRVLEAVRAHHGAGKLTAAICAAPRVLAEAGIVSGVPITSHPSVQDELGDAVVLPEPRVLRSENVWTSQGPGTAMEFAIALVAELCGRETAVAVAGAMVFSGSG